MVGFRVLLTMVRLTIKAATQTRVRWTVLGHGLCGASALRHAAVGLADECTLCQCTQSMGAAQRRVMKRMVSKQ
eukprot:SAG31_NODE_20220_length_580_cov_4.318087_1_plen_73_part_01